MKGIYPLIAILLFLLAGCTNHDTTLLIGVSQCSDDDWRTQLNKEIIREVQFYPNVAVEIRAANDNSTQQVNDIEELIGMGVDLLIVAPNVVDDVTPAIDKARRQGIPIVLIDRRTRTEQYTAYVGANNYDIGRRAGEYIVNRLHGKGQLVELTGLQASTPAIDRHRGLDDVLQNYPDLSVIAQADAGWLEGKAETVFDSLLNVCPHIDLVFAHNDRMASGAYRAAVRQGREKEMLFVGVDALSGEGRGVDMVAQGKLDATFIYPTGGEEVVKVAMNILQGKPYQRENTLSTALVNKANARIMQMQTTQINDLDQKIETLNNQLDNFLMRYSLQRMLLVTCSVILLLVIALLFFVVRAFWTKKRMNAELKEQKKKLEEQRDQLIELSEQLEKATQAKLAFFTSVSHDFRTPLTLITDPVAQLLKDNQLKADQRTLLELIQRNANLLLNLINQILDFRQFEEGKLKLHLTHFDLSQALERWVEAFRPVTYRKHIHLETAIAAHASCLITADAGKLERIVYNLLSNAFKYTPENGTVCVRLMPDDNCFILQISDTGIGISKENQKYIFESFYQADTRHEGSGIGLALVKAFVEMHHGSIDVSSETGKGSTFTVTLPAKQNDGKEENDEITIPETTLCKDAVEETPQENVVPPPPRLADDGTDTTKESVLIIDDNPDIRSYVRLSLKDEYCILEATNGQEGIQMAQKYVPDIILCDIMMPVMDGMECCRRLKAGLQTSHIPVIMLTAYTLDEQRIKGYECGADSYVSKPFSAQLLSARIRNLINNRHHLQDFFTKHPERQQEIVGNIDKTFLEKMKELIEQHIADSDFNVESLGSEIGLSRVQLYRKCKALTNYSPNELLRITRLKRGAFLISTTEKSVSEIAYMVGFSSPSYFTKCYKEYYGKSPTEELRPSSSSKQT